VKPQEDIQAWLKFLTEKFTPAFRKVESREEAEALLLQHRAQVKELLAVVFPDDQDDGANF